MTSIVEVASYLPAQVPLADRQQDLGLSDVELRRFTRAFGYDRVCFDPQQSEVDLLLGAAGKLEGLRGLEDQVRFVLRPRSVPMAAPYPMSPLHEAGRRLGLEHAVTFALTDQACASALLAIDLAGALLGAEQDPRALALVFVGEKTYGRSAQIIPGMAVLGEATVAVLVGAHGTRDRVLGYAATTEPIPDSALTLDATALAVFGAMYSATLQAVIAQALAVAGLTAADIDLYLPHNVNRMVCLRTATALGLTASQVVTETIAQTGHCWGADPFLNYRSCMDLGRLAPGQRYLMTSVGLGATFAAMVLEH